MTQPELDVLFDEIVHSDLSVPTDRMRAIDRFKEAFGPEATLLDACLGLRMALNGSGDPLSCTGDLESKIAALQARINVWTPTRLQKEAAFDRAVYDLVVATIDLASAYV